MAVLFRRDDLPARPAAAQEAAAPGSLPGGVGEPTIEEVVRGRLVAAEFQPIVRLDSREVVAFEAFARGPAGTQWERPALMFPAAKAAGLAGELDLVAHAAAFQAALAAKLHPSTSVFINTDPTSVGRQVPDDLAGTLAVAFARLRVFVELSERALMFDPAATLAGIGKARAAGWGVSLDNVGVDAESLALMPFAHPDVVKIDVSLVHEHTHPHAPRVMSAITSHAERTKASIMALGIETEAHLRTARGLGAVLGQGYLFGRPGQLPGQVHAPVDPITLIDSLPPIDAAETPFTLATAGRAALPVAESVLAALAGHLEQRAAVDPDPTVVLACLPRNQLVSGAPMTFLQMLARSASYIAAVVGEMPAHTIPDVRLVPLAEDDPLRGEWAILLIGPHYSALLTAREQGRGGELGYRLVYDRATVVRAARVILQRITRAAN